MSKFLWWIVLGLVGWWLIKRLKADGSSAPPRGPDSQGGSAAGRSGPTATGTPAQPLVMLRCAHCGLHLPEADALHDAAQRPYCSSAHRSAGPR